MTYYSELSVFIRDVVKDELEAAGIKTKDPVDSVIAEAVKTYNDNWKKYTKSSADADNFLFAVIEDAVSDAIAVTGCAC